MIYRSGVSGSRDPRSLAASILVMAFGGCLHRPALSVSPVAVLDAGRAPRNTALNVLDFTLGAKSEFQQVLNREIEVISPGGAKRSLPLPKVHQTAQTVILQEPHGVRWKIDIPPSAPFANRLDTEAGRLEQALEERYAYLFGYAILDQGSKSADLAKVPPLQDSMVGCVPMAMIWGWDCFERDKRPPEPVGVGARWQQVTSPIDFRVVYTLLEGGTLEGSRIQAEFSQHLGPRALPELGVECSAELNGKDETATTPAVPVASRRGELTLATHCRRLAPEKPGDPPADITLHARFEVVNSPRE